MAYANSRFKAEVNEQGIATKWIEPGDKISQSDIGVSDEEWEYLQEIGAVVKDYPKDLDSGTPPAQHFADNPDDAPDSPLDATSPSADVMAAADAGKPLPTEPGTNDPAGKSELKKS